MKFDTPATENPIDQLKVVGQPVDRIDGPLKTTGTARYAYDWHDAVPNQAYGYVVGSAIAKGQYDRWTWRPPRRRRACSPLSPRKIRASSARENATPPCCLAAPTSTTITRPSQW